MEKDMPSKLIESKIIELQITNKFLIEKMCENSIYDDNIQLYQEIKTNKKQIFLLELLKNN